MPVDPNTGLNRNPIDPKTGRPRRGRPPRYLRGKNGELLSNPDFADRRERLTAIHAEKDQKVIEDAKGYPAAKYNEDPEVPIPEIPPSPESSGYPRRLPKRKEEEERKRR